MAKRRTRRAARNPRSKTQAGPVPGSQLNASYASIYPGHPSPGQTQDPKVAPQLSRAVERLERKLRLPVWLLVQDAKLEDEEEYGKDTMHMIGDTIAGAFFAARHSSLVKGQRIALLIDSNGGLARSAYELAMLLRRHCGGFVAVIPRHAKSAATLLSLGADSIVMNDHAELGPLDVQVWDAEREELLSGLDEVQALERLHAFAMGAFDKMMFMLLKRTGKRSKTLMPLVSQFVARLAEPMFERIDVVRFTQMSRALRIAQEYGERLLASSYGERGASISRILTEEYPEHGFPIYPNELEDIGLKLAPLDDELRGILEEITLCLSNTTCIGRIERA